MKKNNFEPNCSQRFFRAIKSEYTSKGVTPFLVYDQINELVGRVRDKKENAERENSLRKNVMMIAEKVIYNSSVNIEKELLGKNGIGI